MVYFHNVCVSREENMFESRAIALLLLKKVSALPAMVYNSLKGGGCNNTRKKARLRKLLLGTDTYCK